MAVKGQIARANVSNKIREVFGADYIGEAEKDKKLYVWANDGGERIQICIALTRATKEFGAEPAKDLDFSDDAVEIPVVEKKKVEISDAEKQNIEDIMRRLNLL